MLLALLAVALAVEARDQGDPNVQSPDGQALPAEQTHIASGS
jgi:hypothetical protein